MRSGLKVSPEFLILPGLWRLILHKTKKSIRVQFHITLKISANDRFHLQNIKHYIVPMCSCADTTKPPETATLQRLTKMARKGEHQPEAPVLQGSYNVLTTLQADS